MTARTVLVANPAGLHARLASMFCKEVRRFQCSVTVRSGRLFFSGRSILDVMAADIQSGSLITILCDGPDEAAAARALVRFIEELSE